MPDNRQQPGGLQERLCDVWIDQAQVSWAACEPEKQLEVEEHPIAALLRDTHRQARAPSPHRIKWVCVRSIDPCRKSMSMYLGYLGTYLLKYLPR